MDTCLIKQKSVASWKHFYMYKFRTMKIDSHLRDELKDLNKNERSIFKIENDPRILKEQIFRKFSLDELPQF